MAGKVYNFWRSRPTEAWYQLSQGERESIFQQVEQSQDESGGKTVVFCWSRWSGEQWATFGVSEYPDMESLQKDTERLEKLNWYHYMYTETMIGTPLELSPTVE